MATKLKHNVLILLSLMSVMTAGPVISSHIGSVPAQSSGPPVFRNDKPTVEGNAIVDQDNVMGPYRSADQQVPAPKNTARLLYRNINLLVEATAPIVQDNGTSQQPTSPSTPPTPATPPTIPQPVSPTSTPNSNDLAEIKTLLIAILGVTTLIFIMEVWNRSMRFISTRKAYKPVMLRELNRAEEI